MEKVELARSRRVRSGHLWIFSNELRKSPAAYAPGSLVEVYERSGEFIGIGYINPRSLIAVRLLTTAREEINAEFFRRRIMTALAYRERVMPGRRACRLVYSEGDLLPGLIVDRYGDCLVAQFLTLGIEPHRETILDLLDQIMAPTTIVVRNDSRSRTLEGLPLYRSVVKGSVEPLPEFREGDAIFTADALAGQKTGFFLDQADNRTAFSLLVQGGEGLDLFSYSGAWAVRLALRGCRVTCVDDSETALDLARQNAAMNSVGDRCVTVKDDVFAFLRREISLGRRYDVVVADPPAFVKSRAKVAEALRAYRELNSLVMKLVKAGGMIATSSCSQLVERETFLAMLRDAARDAGRRLRLITLRSQAPDHPILLSMPETEYLKCAFLQTP